ncbi:MAG: hypothetical protein ABJA49_13445 [Betaproteobacteria bacterium]
MSFFKKYNGTTHSGLARLETLIWMLIYGGLLTLLVGVFMGRTGNGDGDLLVVGGSVAAVVGVVLIYLRAHLHED